MDGVRASWTCGLMLLGLSCAASAEAAPLDIDGVRDFFQQHCVGCHGPEKQERSFRVDTLPDRPSSDLKRWSLVLKQLSTNVMPPDSEPPPEVALRRAVVAWIRAQTESRDLPAGAQRRMRIEKSGSSR